VPVNRIKQRSPGSARGNIAPARGRRKRPGGARRLRVTLDEQVPGKILRHQAQRLGTRPFVHCGKETVSYRAANDRANRVANGFLRLGAKKGMRAAILLPNRLEYLDLWFGLSKIGVIQVPLNTGFRSAQILHVLKRAPVDFVVSDPAFDAELGDALQRAGGEVTVLALGSAKLPCGGGSRWLSYKQCIGGAAATEPDATAVSGCDVGAIMNTSGTTGPSKGVQLSHAQQYILGKNIASDLRLGEDDVYYNFFPLFHNTAQAMITLPTLLAGATMVLAEKFSATRFWPDVTAHKCTTFYYIGEILRILLKSTRVGDAKGSVLRAGWGIGASPADFVEFQQRYGVRLRTGYGSTEANVPCFLPRGKVDASSVGRVIPGFEIRIANEQGLPLAAGRTGEILVRSSEPYATMLGYDADLAATVAAWRDLWFHTGDAGYLDRGGNLYFVGRLRDVIRVRGENISAFEIEETVSRIHGIVEVAAIAVPCELGGDDIKVVVVANPAARVDCAAIIAYAQAQLPRHAVPRYVEIVEALPKTETNKIRKNVLRATPFTDNTWDRMAHGTRPV
jgi:crotonobetaine/carnitine-CoA ligase